MVFIIIYVQVRDINETRLLFLTLMSANVDREKRGMSVYMGQRTASLIISIHSYADIVLRKPSKGGQRGG